jgi:hypothetical protein
VYCVTVWLSSRDFCCSRNSTLQIPHLNSKVPVSQDIKMDDFHKPHLFGDKSSNESFWLICISVILPSSSSTTNTVHMKGSDPMHCFRLLGWLSQFPQGWSPIPGAKFMLSLLPSGLFLPSYPVFLLGSKPSIFSGLAEGSWAAGVWNSWHSGPGRIGQSSCHH